MLRVLLLPIFFSFYAQGFVVLLDPGHGGDELGAVRSYPIKGKGKRTVHEKDLCLKVAKKVRDLLKDKYTVYLTRSFDRQLSLEDRAKMADTVKADLFISIHFNSSSSAKYSGFETYYLDNHKNKAISKVERIENKSLSSKDKVINQILIDLVIQKTAKQSRKLATAIHKNTAKKLASHYKIRDRGIKPGLFYVLALSKRPGVLLEGGFMSNPKELSKITKEDYLNLYSKAVSAGIEEYLSSLPQKNLRLF